MLKQHQSKTFYIVPVIFENSDQKKGSSSFQSPNINIRTLFNFLRPYIYQKPRSDIFQIELIQHITDIQTER